MSANGESGAYEYAGLSAAHTAAGRLQRACLERMQAHDQMPNGLPTSSTFVFYELEGMGVVTKNPINSRTGEKRKRTDRQNVSDALMRLRELGLVPWHWVADETRELDVWEFTDNVDEIVDRAMTAGRLDAWDGNPPPLVICESRSLKGVLEQTTMRYLVPICATNGQCGGFLHADVLPLLEQDPSRRVLYLGDLDHQGGQIEANTRDVLVRDLGEELDWARVAITAEQVAERGLTPIQKADNRYKPARMGDAWETEALGQQDVVALVRETLDELIPEPIDDVLEREREAKRRWRESR